MNAYRNGDRIFNSGFLDEEYPDADAAIKSAITQWHMWHYGNTGFTENNVKILVERMKSIYEDFYGPLPKKKQK